MSKLDGWKGVMIIKEWNQGVGNSAVEMSRQIRFWPIFLTNKKVEMRKDILDAFLFIPPKKVVGRRLPKLLDAIKSSIKGLQFLSKL